MSALFRVLPPSLILKGPKPPCRRRHRRGGGLPWELGGPAGRGSRARGVILLPTPKWAWGDRKEGCCTDRYTSGAQKREEVDRKERRWMGGSRGKRDWGDFSPFPFSHHGLWALGKMRKFSSFSQTGSDKAGSSLFPYSHWQLREAGSEMAVP